MKQSKSLLSSPHPSFFLSLDFYFFNYKKIPKWSLANFSILKPPTPPTSIISKLIRLFEDFFLLFGKTFLILRVPTHPWNFFLKVNYPSVFLKSHEIVIYVKEFLCYFLLLFAQSFLEDQTNKNFHIFHSILFKPTNTSTQNIDFFCPLLFLNFYRVRCKKMFIESKRIERKTRRLQKMAKQNRNKNKILWSDKGRRHTRSSSTGQKS